MDPMIKNSFFTILIYWNDNRIHLGLTKKLIFFILFPPLLVKWMVPGTEGRSDICLSIKCNVKLRGSFGISKTFFN